MTSSRLAEEGKSRRRARAWSGYDAAVTLLAEFRKKLEADTLDMVGDLDPFYVFDPYAAGSAGINVWERQSDLVLSMMRLTTDLVVSWQGPGHKICLHLKTTKIDTCQ